MMTQQSHLYIFSGISLLIWTFLVYISAHSGISTEKLKTIALAKKEALITFNKDQAFREWATQHGGVYVRISDKTPPNPYLSHIQNRDITLPSGDAFTLMNPAYMIRQVMHDYGSLYGTNGRITSLKVINPINQPDSWEKNALEILETRTQKEVFEITLLNHIPHLRLMRPMITQKTCLKCHGIQGYKEGDVRGGVGVTLAMTPYLSMEAKTIQNILRSHTIFWVLGVIALITFLFWEKGVIKKELLTKKALGASNENLKIALEEVKTLRGIIPICAYCKKIRDDEGVWNKIEAYIHSHSHAKFSHGICPECYDTQVGEMREITKKKGS